MINPAICCVFLCPLVLFKFRQQIFLLTYQMPSEIKAKPRWRKHGRTELSLTVFDLFLIWLGKMGFQAESRVRHLEFKSWHHSGNISEYVEGAARLACQDEYVLKQPLPRQPFCYREAAMSLCAPGEWAEPLS